MDLPHRHDDVNQIDIRNILPLLRLPHKVLTRTAMTMICLNSTPIQPFSNDLSLLQFMKCQDIDALDGFILYMLPDRHEANCDPYVKIMPDFFEEVDPVIFLVFVIDRPMFFELLVCLWIGHIEVQVISDPMCHRTTETAILEGEGCSSEEHWLVLHEKVMLGDVCKSELSLLVGDLMFRAFEIGLGKEGYFQIVLLFKLSVSPVYLPVHLFYD